MVTETIRLTTAAFQHADYGVNALLPDIPRDASDAEPAALVTVIDPTMSEHAARGEDGNDWPGIVTLVGRDPEFAPEVGTIERDGEIELVHAYITRDADEAQTFVEASLTLRAMRMCLAAFSSEANPGDRERESIYVIGAVRMRLIPWGAPIPGYPDIRHGGALAVRYHARDLAPLID
jgi:hypothetical protein